MQIYIENPPKMSYSSIGCLALWAVGSMKIVSLVKSLEDDAGWEIWNFGYNGPNPPYVRIGAKYRFLPQFGVVPCFESWIRDRIIFRSKIPIDQHLRSYDRIKIDPIAFEEIYGRQHATSNVFPLGVWLRIGPRCNLMDFVMWDEDRTPVCVLEGIVFSIASKIWLSRDMLG